MSRFTRKIKSNWLLTLVLAVPICYVLIQLFLILDRSYVIEVAMPDSLDDVLLCDGIIGVNETENSSNGARITFLPYAKRGACSGRR